MKALLLVSILFSINTFAGELGQAKTPAECTFSNQTVKRESKKVQESSKGQEQEVKSEAARA